MNSSIKIFFTFLFLIGMTFLSFGQEVPILGYEVNENGQVELEVNSSTSKYYILKVRHDISSDFDLFVSMTLGQAGTTTITEPMRAYPIQHYKVLEYSIDVPNDTDDDGIDDITEFMNLPFLNPLNVAEEVEIINGSVAVENFERFEELSILHDEVQWSEFLNGKRFVKFLIVDFFLNPKIYFINSTTHALHADFGNAIGSESIGDHVKKGQIIYHPTSLSNNGTLGTFAFNYSNGHGQDFDIVQRTIELLAANMPFLENNLSHFITGNNEDEYTVDAELYENSRVPVLFESDIYAEIDYWGLNQTEGYGLFRQMTLEEIPGPKDIVLYDALPNSLPRVGGIMTSVVQTPLSHVNLRAIQNNIPNSFVRDPLSNKEITDLLDHYVYYKVEQDSYTIREATIEEVNTWFENIRPDEAQSPPLNLSYTSILPLDQISFDMYDGFGAKCANVATMRTFGFPEGTIPNGFGIPFYFYQQFMAHHGFFDDIRQMMADSNFIADRNTRDEMLRDFRSQIKAAEMPEWMYDELGEIQGQFPEGTSIRCRSSTNNEDLPGFNGAGLYDSKTQHPHEGHISKSIKQVFASLWNLRAFDEREFYWVDHFTASMGILCHPNFSDENANGVAVTTDPLYRTNHTFYLNSQLGEDLITNPENTSVPEEILLDRYSDGDDDYLIVQRSNLIPTDSTIIGSIHLDEMREYLAIIHDEFERIYDAIGNSTFAMDIEFKVTVENQLVIKQARPWVSYVANNIHLVKSDEFDMIIFPNPTEAQVRVLCRKCDLSKIQVTSIMGRLVYEQQISELNDVVSVNIDRNLAPGIYVITAFSANNKAYYSTKFVKR